MSAGETSLGPSQARQIWGEGEEASLGRGEGGKGVEQSGLEGIKTDRFRPRLQPPQPKARVRHLRSPGLPLPAGNSLLAKNNFWQYLNDPALDLASSAGNRGAYASPGNA